MNHDRLSGDDTVCTSKNVSPPFGEVLYGKKRHGSPDEDISSETRGLLG